MPDRDTSPARPGSLDEATARTLQVIDCFFKSRSEAVERELLPQRLRPTYLRDRLIRGLLIAFYAGRKPTLKELQLDHAYQATPTTVANEVKLLWEIGVIAREQTGAAKGKPLYRYCPTQHTVDAHKRAVPVLLARLREGLSTLP